MAPRHEHFIGRGFIALTVALDSIAPVDPAQIASAKNAGITGPGHEERTTWIHVAPFGEWSGHSAGEFALTADHFNAVCAQVAARQTPVSLDYEHASIRPSGEPTPAAGYVLATEVRDSGLWALCEFTPRAAQLVKAAEYRFSSGVFAFDARDQASGEALLCALDTIALTNRPFIDGQHPIALSRRVLSNGAPMEIDLKALAKLLDAIPGANTADKIKKAIDLMAAGQEPPKDAPPVDASKSTGNVVALADNPPAPPPAVACDTPMPPTPPAAMAGDMPDVPPDADNDAAVDEFDAKLMADLGITDVDAYAALLMQNYDAIKALLVGGDATMTAASRDLAVRALTSQLEAVTKERNTLLTEKQAAHAVACAAEVDALIRRAPTLATERESLIALARTQPKEFRRVAAVVAPAAPSLTAPHALALTQPTPSTAVNEVGEDHPRVKAQRVSLANAGIKGDAAERVITNLKKQLIAG